MYYSRTARRLGTSILLQTTTILRFVFLPPLFYNIQHPHIVHSFRSIRVLISIHTYALNTAVSNRSRLWRADAQDAGIRFTTAIDGDEAEWIKSYAPPQGIRPIRPIRLELPSRDTVARSSPQALLPCAYRLRPLHGAASLFIF